MLGYVSAGHDVRHLLAVAQVSALATQLHSRYCAQLGSLLCEARKRGTLHLSPEPCQRGGGGSRRLHLRASAAALSA